MPVHFSAQSYEGGRSVVLCYGRETLLSPTWGLRRALGFPVPHLQAGTAEGSTCTHTFHACFTNTDANDITLSPQVHSMNALPSPRLSSLPGGSHWLAPIFFFNWTFILFSIHKGLGLLFCPPSSPLNHPCTQSICVFQILVKVSRDCGGQQDSI